MRYIYIFLLLSIVFIPSFGALDKANTQWLYLSVLPILLLITSLNKFGFNLSKSKIFIIYLLFFFQILLSLFYTNNFSISIIDFSRHCSILILLFLIIHLFIKENLSFYRLSLIVTFFLLFETLLSLQPLFKFAVNNGFNFSTITSINIDGLKGVTGNRNITTASIIIKLPFLIFIIYQSNNFLKYIFSALSFFPVLSLFLINSRAALLSFLTIIFIIVLTIAFLHFKKIKRILLLIFPFVCAYIFANSLMPNETSTTSQRLASINFSNESSSHRLFLWENAIDYISLNPFIGCGIGNWKVESAFYWGSFGSKYLVPFHAHNDFLEFSTELGILGGITYLTLFLFVFFKLFKLYVKLRDFHFVILFCSWLALFVDSSLNFPFERPIIQTMFLLLLALIISYEYSSKTQ